LHPSHTYLTRALPSRPPLRGGSRLNVDPSSTQGFQLSILPSRRGDMGKPNASMANLETPIPLIDLVNESLELLGSDTSKPHGAVYDTSWESLASFNLGDGPEDLHAKVMFDAIPEHSSPAIPVGTPSVYSILNTDFTAPILPYAQDLDVNRSYLCRLGLTRFDTMHHFRENITEFALDPVHEPADFQKSLWRFPIRFDIAMEYLCITEAEMQHLYTTTLSDAAIADILGFSPTSEVDWPTVITQLPIFLEKLGLSYCEFLDLWRCGFVPFQPGGERGTFPTCEPCCLKSIDIAFPGEILLRSIQKTIIFVRLWRRLQDPCGNGGMSFSLLAAICEVLKLFNGSDVNPGFIRQLVALLMLRDLFCLPLEESTAIPVPTEGKGIIIPPERRVSLLAIWIGPDKAPSEWQWAIRVLLDCIEQYAIRVHHCRPRTAEFKRMLAENLDRLSKLAGFTTSRPWNATPACTLRFAEILAKVCASEYTVGEILFLFTNDEHLLGDDPFPYTEPSESEEDPLNVSEDYHDGLWKLREELLEAKPTSALLRSGLGIALNTRFGETSASFRLQTPISLILYSRSENTSSLASWSATAIVFGSMKGGFRPRCRQVRLQF
jgi:hypothetical protein